MESLGQVHVLTDAVMDIQKNIVTGRIPIPTIRDQVGRARARAVGSPR